MVGIFGIGGGPVRANDVEQAQSRATREAAPAPKKPQTSADKDALAASDVARFAGLANMAASDADIRAERVAEAQRNIEQGIHRIQEVVQIVAARISRYIQMS